MVPTLEQAVLLVPARAVALPTPALEQTPGVEVLLLLLLQEVAHLPAAFLLLLQEDIAHRPAVCLPPFQVLRVLLNPPLQQIPLELLPAERMAVMEHRAIPPFRVFRLCKVALGNIWRGVVL